MEPVKNKYLFEDETVVAYENNLDPVAKVHFVVEAKNAQQIKSLNGVSENDEKLLGHLMKVAAQVARQKGLTEGFRTVINNGKNGCQAEDGLKIHVIGGQQLTWPPGVDQINPEIEQIT